MSLMHDALREMEKMPPADGLTKPTLTYDTSPTTREQDSSGGSRQQRSFRADYEPADARDDTRRVVPTSGGWMLGAILCLCLLTSCNAQYTRRGNGTCGRATGNASDAGNCRYR